MRLLSKFFLGVLLLTMASVSWGACNDLLCGKWRMSKPPLRYVMEYVASTDGYWDIESRLVELGGIPRGMGFRSGMTISRLNRVREGKYVGETMWRNTFGALMGFYPVTLILTNENSFRLTGTPPPGRIINRSATTGRRIGLAPKQISKPPEEKPVGGSGTGFFVLSPLSRLGPFSYRNRIAWHSRNLAG